MRAFNLAISPSVMLNLFQHPLFRMDDVRHFAMNRQPCVYILASRPRGTLYIGVTSNLPARLHQHRSGEIPGFTTRYDVHRLVRFEAFEDMLSAIAREKRLKRWHRQWKINLVETGNPHWDDLATGFGFEPVRSRGPMHGP